MLERIDVGSDSEQNKVNTGVQSIAIEAWSKPNVAANVQPMRVAQDDCRDMTSNQCYDYKRMTPNQRYDYNHLDNNGRYEYDHMTPDERYSHDHQSRDEQYDYRNMTPDQRWDYDHGKR